MLRNLLEKTATFLGYSRWEEVLLGLEVAGDEITTENIELYAQRIDLFTHNRQIRFGVRELQEREKNTLIELFNSFEKNYKFNQKRKMKMVDYSKVHEVIAETNEGILLAEYQPEYRTDREFQSEADLERQLLTDLVNGLNYERLDIHTPTELLANAKVQIEKLNKVTFTDAEWQRFIVEY